jgi:16S rRNA (adenine1518-N6/adenine1519-N6)-dimethyltransferase
LPEEKDMTVIEIGPGTGVLTRFLVQKPYKKYVPVEIDDESVAYLRNKYPQLRDSLLHADFLKMDDPVLRESPLYIIGNFPYNISSQILFRILAHRDRVDSVVCMLQKEVADRIAAPPGSKTYGILSVLLQAFYIPRYRFSVNPGSFFPPPRVKSAVLTLTRNDTTKLDCDEALFFRVVKTTFNQRRKTIRNSLKTILLTLGDENELLSMRPEQLGVGEFIELTNFVSSRV